MAFPQVAATNTSSEGSAVTSHTVALPASISSGNLLIAIFVSVEVPTWPSGWTQFLNGGVIFGAYRDADGAEGASVTVTTSSSSTSAHNTYRITGWGGTPEAAVSSTSESASPDPPSLSPSWGARDTLWIAAAGWPSTATLSSYPSSYSGGINVVNADGAASAQRELDAATEDPGAFEISASSLEEAATIAVEPEFGDASGSGSFTLSALQLSGTGYLDVDGQGGLTFASLQLDGAGTVLYSGEGDLTLPSLSLSADFLVGTIGSGGITLNGLNLSGVGFRTGGEGFPGPGDIQATVIVPGKIADPALEVGERLSPVLTMRATKKNVSRVLRISESAADTRLASRNLPGRFIILVIDPSVEWWQVSRAAVEKFVN